MHNEKMPKTRNIQRKTMAMVLNKIDNMELSQQYVVWTYIENKNVLRGIDFRETRKARTDDGETQNGE